MVNFNSKHSIHQLNIELLIEHILYVSFPAFNVFRIGKNVLLLEQFFSCRDSRCSVDPSSDSR